MVISIIALKVCSGYCEVRMSHESAKEAILLGSNRNKDVRDSFHLLLDRPLFKALLVECQFGSSERARLCGATQYYIQLQPLSQAGWTEANRPTSLRWERETRMPVTAISWVSQRWDLRDKTLQELWDSWEHNEWSCFHLLYPLKSGCLIFQSRPICQTK